METKITIQIMNDQQQRAFDALTSAEGWTREDWFVAGWNAGVNATRAQADARPVAWIEKEQLEQLQDVTADAWVYWRETDHVAEDDEIALFIHPAETDRPHVAVVDAGDDGKWAELVPDIGEDLPIGTKLYTAAEAATLELDIRAAAARLMGWRLPDDFSPDCYVVFDRVKAKFNNSWPVGTNLLTLAQAEEMLRYAFADQITHATVAEPKQRRIPVVLHGHEIWSGGVKLGVATTERIAKEIADALNSRSEANQQQAEPSTFRDSVEAMVRMLEEGEWAEHVAATTGKGDSLSQRLETVITGLINETNGDAK